MPGHMAAICVASSSLIGGPMTGWPVGWSGVSQPLPSAERGGLGQQRVAEGDVGQGQAAVPEQDGLLAVLPARPQARDDLAKLGVQAARGRLARLDVGA